ncbi:hypothetical protein [Flavobacterium sp.]
MESKIITSVRLSDSGCKHQFGITRMSKKYLLLFVFLVSISGFSQSVNDYQYVIVPTKFTGFKENDKYRLNSTTKLMLEKYGFKTYMSTDDIPAEITDCQRLYADLVQDKDFLSTKVKVVLKDCKEKVVFETDFGKSREKDFSISFNQALRETSKSFDRLNYRYNGKTPVATPADANPQPIGKSNTVDVTATNPRLVENADMVYFAQPTATGFQVIDNEPKIIMRLFNTSQKDVFIAQRDNLSGVLITRNGQWFFEFYQNARFVSELIKLKF